MWSEADVTAEIDQVDRDVMIVVITTPSEDYRLLGK
jgi:hypothetical protein